MELSLASYSYLPEVGERGKKSGTMTKTREQCHENKRRCFVLALLWGKVTRERLKTGTHKCSLKSKFYQVFLG